MKENLLFFIFDKSVLMVQKQIIHSIVKMLGIVHRSKTTSNLVLLKNEAIAKGKIGQLLEFIS